MGVEWGGKNAGRWLPGLRPTSPPGGTRRATSSAGTPPQRNPGEGRVFALAPLPSSSRRQDRLSPYAAYLAALAAICGT